MTSENGHDLDVISFPQLNLLRALAVARCKSRVDLSDLGWDDSGISIDFPVLFGNPDKDGESKSSSKRVAH